MKNPQILVIDDEKNVRDLLKALLQRRGYRVLTASSGAAGLAVLREHPIDLVITDLRMPSVTGEQVLERVKKEWPVLPVVVISAFGAPRNIVEVIKSGAEDYLSKPFEDEELEVVVLKALEKHRLLLENLRLRRQLEQGVAGLLVGQSPAMRKVHSAIASVAQADAAVLITGESGTGKELAAVMIHRASSRKDQPFVEVNAGAVPASLFEAEFFGAKRGAYTDAHESRGGYFKEADGGILFLDEVGEIPWEQQAKLLRVLETGVLRPVGSTKPEKVSVRLVAATNRDLAKMVEEGRFRRDLYFRLSVLPLHLPPLRERLSDVSLLAEHFIRQVSSKDERRLSAGALKALLAHAWPGNVRELKNVVERALVFGRGKILEAGDLVLETAAGARPVHGSLEAAKKHNQEQFEKAYLLQVLEDSAWNVSKAAKVAGKDRANFHALMRKHGLKRA